MFQRQANNIGTANQCGITDIQNQHGHGVNYLHNLAAACSTCNTSSGTGHFAVYLAKMLHDQDLPIEMAMRYLPAFVTGKKDARDLFEL